MGASLFLSVALLPFLCSLSSAAGYFSQINPCPNSCSILGLNPSNWTVIHDLEKFSNCNETVIFDLSLYNDLENPRTLTTLRSCMVTSSQPVPSKVEQRSPGNIGCGNFKASRNASVEIIWSTNKTTPLRQSQLDELFDAIKLQLTEGEPECRSKVLLGKLGDGTLVGVYGGKNIDSLRSFDNLSSQISAHVLSNSLGADIVAAQHCGGGKDGSATMGVLVSTTGDLGLAQRVLQTWHNATCVKGLGNSSGPRPVTIYSTSNSGTKRPKALKTRDGTCSTIQVVSGDSCGSLASECGISGSQFEMFNPVPNLCSALAVGQFVCCTSGALPDLRPQPQSDGSCFQYTVQADDFCDAIAHAHFITSDDIETFNKQTWGWQGCNNVQLGQSICLSSGSPPFPAPVSNVVCGPQVPGTKPPSDFSKLAEMNPCPLNSCCDIFGQCGITPDFCTVSKSDTGAPGTSAPGTAGCISNCGTDIVNNDSGPSSFLKIGYWESFAVGRSCLRMSASQIPSDFTHVHYAFASITSGFEVDTSDPPGQFEDFVQTSGFKKIVSFGGWSFSTDFDSFPIFREGVTTANRREFAQNIVDMLNRHNLDGVDFDWEYPGAPDIPGIPPGSPEDGANYLEFLQILRNILPSGKTMSMAAPASYWYLKGFPIKDMAPLLDYIVYMTYDLHGQWDFGNAFSNPGCAAGNCLRSHINLTETDYSLAMITKAGVPTNKIAVGVSSYGRAFGITTAGCIGPTCTFDGPDSNALLGPCTQESGYLADAEIDALLQQGGVKLRDDASDSDIVVFGNTWVAYMDSQTKAERISRYKSQNFIGSVDWAIDLESGPVSGVFGNDTDNHPTPTKVPISHELTCVDLADGATFTLTADCAHEIASLPPLTDNNSPPGPSHCTESCDVLRQITGTCCGTGGTIGFPIVIIPGVEVPLPLPLPPGFVPTSPITTPGFTLKPGQPAPVPFILPKGFKSPSPFTIPGHSFPPGVPIRLPVILPAGFVPAVPFEVSGTTHAAGSPLDAPLPLPPDFVPPPALDGPFVVPPMDVFPGDPGLPGPAAIPAGWTNSSPTDFTVPPSGFPSNSPIPPPGAVLPPGFVLPQGSAPITFPAGSGLPSDSFVPASPAGGEDGDQEDGHDPNAPFLAPVIDPQLDPEQDEVVTTTVVSPPQPTGTLIPFPELCPGLTNDALSKFTCAVNCEGGHIQCPPWCCTAGCRGFSC